MSSTAKNTGITKALSGFSIERFATTIRADFRFAPLNVLLLVAFFVIGLVVHLVVHAYSLYAVGLFLGSALVLASCLRLTQVWEAVVILGTADGLLGYLLLRPESEIFLITVGGQIIRSGVDTVSSVGRNTMGVRVIRLRAGDEVAAMESIAAAELNDSEEPAEAEAPSTDGP